MPGRIQTTKALHGMSWMLVNTTVSRLIVFLSQLVLGYLLVPKDFGIYALALSVTNALAAIRNGGTQQLLIQRGDGYREILSDSTQYALIFNLIGFAALFFIAPISSHFIKEGGITLLCLAIGLSLPLGTFGTVYRVELSILGRFKEVAILSTISTVLWQLEVIVFALLGFGPYSYAVPMILQSVLDGLLGWYFLRSWPMNAPRISRSTFMALFRETRWIMLGAAMLSLGLTGHYFAAGLNAVAEVVGLFFFGFQLAYTLFVILNNGIESVIPPMLAQLNSNREAQGKMVVDMLAVLLVVSISVAGAVAVASEAIIHVLWGGRWDRSAVVLRYMSLSLPAWVIIAIVRAVLEARGQWRTRFLLLSAYGIGTVLVVGFSAGTAEVGTMAFSLTTFYIALGLLLLPWCAWLMKLPQIAIWSTLVRPLFLSIACLALSSVAVSWFPRALIGTSRELVEATIFSALIVIGNVYFFRALWLDAISVFRGRKLVNDA